MTLNLVDNSVYTEGTVLFVYICFLTNKSKFLLVFYSLIRTFASKWSEDAIRTSCLRRGA